jgi:hypothetical protein
MGKGILGGLAMVIIRKNPSLILPLQKGEGEKDASSRMPGGEEFEIDPVAIHNNARLYQRGVVSLEF